MHDLLIAYATREGHTREIAQHFADTLNALGVEVTVRPVTDREIDLASFDRVVLAASVHLGRHERSMVKFIKRHRDLLASKRAALISVAGATAAAEHAQDPQRREQYTRAAQDAVAHLFEETGWDAGHVEYVGGAFLYRQYNWLVRFIMRGIAKSEGLSTDTTQDHDYTNWVALDRFAAGFVTDAPPSHS